MDTLSSKLKKLSIYTRRTLSGTVGQVEKNIIKDAIVKIEKTSLILDEIIQELESDSHHMGREHSILKRLKNIKELNL